MADVGILVGLIAGVWALLLWLSIVVWVYRDIRERTRDLGLQVLALFVAVLFFPGFNIPGLALYLMLRPRETLEEAYARSLEEEALLREIGDEGMCPSCRRFVDRGWRLCPFCATQLKDICTKCSQLLSFNWVACPYCGTERRGAHVPETAMTPAAPPMPTPPPGRPVSPATARAAVAEASASGQSGRTGTRMATRTTTEGGDDSDMVSSADGADAAVS
ncbi:MAG: zinc ribbon domain-containing protein [Chloroflexota bacterium]